MEDEVVTLIGYWIAAFLTICILSFLYKDNPFYKFAEHLFVGVSAGYGVVLQLYDTIIPKLFTPLASPLADAGPISEVVTAELEQGWGLTKALSGAFYSAKDIGGWWFVYAGALVLSLMMFSKFSRTYSWMARWPLAFVVGTFAGLQVIASTSGDLVLQVQANMLPLVAESGLWWDSVNNILMIVGLICALLYFFFSRPHTGALGVASRIGIYFMMVSFGASFGYTVMGRISLAIGRAQELIEPGDAHPGAPWPAIVSLMVVGAGLVVLEKLGKLKDDEA